MKKITISVLLAVIAMGLVTPLVYAAEGETLEDICERKRNSAGYGFDQAVCDTIDTIKVTLVELDDRITSLEGTTDRIGALLSGMLADITSNEQNITALDTRVTNIELGNSTAASIVPVILERVSRTIDVLEGQQRAVGITCPHGLQVLSYEIQFSSGVPRALSNLEVQLYKVGVAVYGLEPGANTLELTANCGEYRLV